MVNSSWGMKAGDFNLRQATRGSTVLDTQSTSSAVPEAMDRLASLPYKASVPGYRPGIGLIGCGGISRDHLQAYRNASLDVVALCDLDRSLAQQRADEFYPEATIFDDYRDLLRSDSIEVVDITTHPPQRPAIVEASLRARKHVLSQKPFVLDLEIGQKLIDLADEQECYLAVNQNGRWAPHFSYARQVAASGLIGTVFGVHMGCHWDHTWTAGTEFENIKHLILYDYAIHWFDILRAFLPGKATRVFASTARIPNQALKPDLLAQAVIEFEQGRASLAFDAGLPFGPMEETFLAATAGALHSTGSGNQEQTVTVTTEQGKFSPLLSGKWFPNAFEGTMCELLCAIEEKRPCSIAASDNLHSLALCFAAIHSAETGEPVIPGSIRKMPGA